MFFLEFLGIGSIPIFIATLISPEFIIDKLQFLDLEKLLLDLSHNKIIIYFSFFVVLIYLSKSLFLIFLTIYQNKFLENAKIKIATKVFSHYINMEYINHLEKDPAELSRKITADISMLGIYIQQYLAVVREVAVLVVILFLLIWASPSIVLLVASILSIITYLYISKIKKILDEKSNTNKLIGEENFKIVNEIFGSIKDLKILMKENDMISYFNSNVKKIEKNIFFFQVVEKIPRVVLEIFAILVLTSSTVILVISSQNFNNLLPFLALITFAVFRFIPAFSAISTAKYYMQISIPYLNSLNEVSSEIAEDENIKKKDLNNYLNSENENDKNKYIDIKNLNFSYPGNKITQLKNVSFDIKKNTTTGIIGKTGAGKSTLFYILLGLIKPTSGTITNNGEDIFTSLTSWRKKIGSVSQNIFLLDSTIEKNITFNLNNEDVDTKKLNKAIKVSQLESKIKNLPLGLKTKVGNNGIKLSGGERQRLAISRILYQDPEIIFLDESTNSLDFKTEKLILDGIKENFKDKTIIMIAHRQNLVEYCDKVWSLESGSLIEN